MNKLLLRRLAVGAAVFTLEWLIPQRSYSADPVEIIQSTPVETTLAVSGIPDAQKTWVDLFNNARSQIDIEQFYITDGPSLSPVLDSIMRAAARGIPVRLLVDLKFYKQYPESVDRLSQTKNIQARTIDYGALTGGVQHAKYFIIDRGTCFLGSQNFDWRALTHIHETGALISQPVICNQLTSVFEKDWCSGVAIGSQVELKKPAASKLVPMPDILFVASPASMNPPGVHDTISALLGLINNAKKTLKLEVMEFSTKIYGSNGSWTDLDQALKRAAQRGVQVEILVDVSNLQKAKEDMISLSKQSNITLKLVTIPPWSGGQVAYARLIHSKYLIVDDEIAWLGTENCSKGYFYNSRDVGLVFKTAGAVRDLVSVFEKLWQSSYARGM